MFDIQSIDEATAGKVEAKTSTYTAKPCKVESCDNDSIRRSAMCQTHKDEYDALKVERYKGYRNLVRNAATAANNVEDETSAKLLIRLTNGRAGFAYFAKEALPKYVVKNHGFGGLVLKVTGTKKAEAFARVLADSQEASDEDFNVQLMQVINL